MEKESLYGNGLLSIVKGSGVAVAISFLATVMFAGALRAWNLSEAVIYPVNQIIKALSVAIGALAFVKGDKGWLKGFAIGGLYTALSYLTFSAVGGDFSLSWMIFVELALALASGGLCGIIAVNVKKE